MYCQSTAEREALSTAWYRTAQAKGQRTALGSEQRSGLTIDVVFRLYVVVDAAQTH